MNEYVETDEFEDVEASLLAIKILLPHVEAEPLLWKNILLNVHSSVQSACVCFLTGTDGRGALSSNSDAALLAYHTAQTQVALGEMCESSAPEYPEKYMDNLPDLLAKLPAPLTVRKYKTYKDCVTARERDFYLLHSFRNDNVHFQPVSWCIEIAGLPRICRTALELVQRISTSSGWRRYSRFGETRVSELTGDLLEKLEKLECA